MTYIKPPDSCVRQLINPIIVYKDTTGMTNHMILLGDFNTKLGVGNIFKPTSGNESLHHDRNDNGVRILNLDI